MKEQLETLKELEGMVPQPKASSPKPPPVVTVSEGTTTSIGQPLCAVPSTSPIVISSSTASSQQKLAGEGLSDISSSTASPQRGQQKLVGEGLSDVSSQETDSSFDVENARSDLVESIDKKLFSEPAPVSVTSGASTINSTAGDGTFHEWDTARLGPDTDVTNAVVGVDPPEATVFSLSATSVMSPAQVKLEILLILGLLLLKDGLLNSLPIYQLPSTKCCVILCDKLALYS